MSTVRQQRGRVVICSLCLLCCFLGIFGRLLWLQYFASESMADGVLHSSIGHQRLAARRGEIVDRHLQHVFAYDAEAYQLTVDKKHVPLGGIEKLAAALQVEADPLQEQMEKAKGRHVLLKVEGQTLISRARAEPFLTKKDSWNFLSVTRSVRRQYGPYAAHTIGFMSEDGKPRGGLEAYYDAYLRGRDGQMEFRKTKHGLMVGDAPLQTAPAQHGLHVVTTLDARLQHEVETRLQATMEKTQAKGGVAAVMDPNTGEMLALASSPTFSPNDYVSSLTPENQLHRAANAVYEPGSTFKIFTLAAALEEGLFQPESHFLSAPYAVGKQVIHEAKREGYGMLTYREGVEKSSNVLMVQLGQQLAPERYASYIKRFGIADLAQRQGYRSGIDLPNEAKTLVSPRALEETQLASMSFGQGIAINPFQQMAMMGAVANGGVMHTPRLLKELRQDQSEEVRGVASSEVVTGEGAPKAPEPRRVMSGATASQIRELLQGVVERGTGQRAQMEDLCVAGKTGTGQKAKDGVYVPGAHVSSFLGFAPCDQPRFVFFVMVDEPQAGLGGGDGAAPLAKEILQAIHR